MIEINTTDRYTEIYINGGGYLTSVKTTNFHTFFKRKMLTKDESVEDFKEITEQEKVALENSDSEWTEPPKSFVEQWNAVCGTYGRYNPDTGFFELNDIADLSYEEALTVLPLQILALNTLPSNYNFYGYEFRTIVIHVNRDIGKHSVVRFLGNNNKLESVMFTAALGATNINHAFMNCRNLKTIIGNIDIGECSNTQMVVNAFYECGKLEEVRIDRLRVDISFQYSPNLSYDSFRHMVENRLSGSLQQPFSITVHPDVYAKLTDPENTEWHQLNQDAIEKQITFVTV